MNTQNYNYDLAEIERKLTSSSNTVPMVKISNFFDSNAGTADKLARNVHRVMTQHINNK